jgi:flagellar biogenesis protein FliO
MFLQLIFSLLKVAAVFGLLALTLGLVGKWHRQRGGVRSSAKGNPTSVEKLDELRVGRNGSVVTLRVGETVLLLGVTEQSIAHLADVTDEIDLTSTAEIGDLGSPTPFETALALLRDRRATN